MEKIIIKKSGLYFSFWDEDTLSWTDRLISDSDLPITWYFQYSIEIEEFLTISDLLLLFAQYQEDLEFAFSKSLLIVPFDEILSIINKPVGLSLIEPTELYLIKLGEIRKSEISIPYIISYPTLMGLEVIGETGDEDVLYSLTDIKFDDWCTLTIQIDDYLEYMDPEKNEVEFEGIIQWTLYEALSCIFAQITNSITFTKIKDNPEEFQSVNTGGPIIVSELFSWIDDIDKYFKEA